MNRSLLTAAIASMGLTLFAAAPTLAAGHPGSGPGHPSTGPSHAGSMNGHHGDYGHSIKASSRFDYGKYGFKSMSWTHSYWSNHYHRYCYWSPRYGWCFYEPTYACYLPVTYFGEVYPETPFVPSAVSPTLPVIQQTTVVTGTPATAVSVPPPPPTPVVAPVPTAIQQTKVGAGVP